MGPCQHPKPCNAVQLSGSSGWTKVLESQADHLKTTGYELLGHGVAGFRLTGGGLSMKVIPKYVGTPWDTTTQNN